MTRTVKFTFLTQEHYDQAWRYARENKHMTLPEFARFAVNEYMKKYEAKRAPNVSEKDER